MQHIQIFSSFLLNVDDGTSSSGLKVATHSALDFDIFLVFSYFTFPFFFPPSFPPSFPLLFLFFKNEGRLESDRCARSHASLCSSSWWASACSAAFIETQSKARHQRNKQVGSNCSDGSVLKRPYRSGSDVAHSWRQSVG